MSSEMTDTITRVSPTSNNTYTTLVQTEHFMWNRSARLVASAQQTKVTYTCTFVAAWLKLLIYYPCPDINVVTNTHNFLPIVSILPLQNGQCKNHSLIQGGYYIHSRLYNSYHTVRKVQDYKLFKFIVTPPPHLSFGTFVKRRKVTICFAIFVRQHQTTWLPLDEFSWNSILMDFPKICSQNSSLIKIWRYMKMCENFW